VNARAVIRPLSVDRGLDPILEHLVWGHIWLVILIVLIFGAFSPSEGREFDTRDSNARSLGLEHLHRPDPVPQNLTSVRRVPEFQADDDKQRRLKADLFFGKR
jgi:hypothetical protein